MSKSLQTAAAAQGFKIMIWGKQVGDRKGFRIGFFLHHENLEAKLGPLACAAYYDLGLS